MSDFNFKYGSAGGAVVAALVALFGYLVFPYLLLTSLILMMSGLEVDENLWTAIFEDWRQLIFVLSVPLIILAFFRGYYWKGAYSRLSVALVMGAIFIVLVWMLQLDGRVQSALDAEELDLQVSTFIYFFLGFAALWILFYVGEYFDERKEFEKRRNLVLNVPPPMPEKLEDPRKHLWWHDFRLRYGKYALGFKSARRYYGRFMVWPILFFMVVTAALLKVNDLVPFELQNELEDAVTLLFYTGLVLVGLAFFKGFYPKGSVSRMTFWIALVAVVCIWIWFFLFGGSLVVDIADIAELSIGYTPIVLILMFAASLWGVYAAVELWSYRYDWKANHFRPVNEKVKKRKDEKRASNEGSAEKL
jgi:hypothetical protein